MRNFELQADSKLGEMEQEIFSKLDFVAAVTSKCLLVSVKWENPCPRLVRVEEDVVHASTPSRFSHYRRNTMDRFRRKTAQAQGSTVEAETLPCSIPVRA